MLNMEKATIQIMLWGEKKSIYKFGDLFSGIIAFHFLNRDDALAKVLSYNNIHSFSSIIV